MSQVAPVMHREAVAPTKRKPLTPKQRREILDRQADQCGECGVSLIWQVVEGQKVYGPMIDEHVLRLFVAGSNELRNRQLWCTGCSKAKTKAEAAPNAKIRRILEWDEEADPSRINGRGFDRTKTRDFKGQVRPRKERAAAQQALSRWSGSEADCETDPNTTEDAL